MKEFLQNYIGRRIRISTINNDVYGELVSVEETGAVLKSTYESGSIVFANYEYITSVNVEKERKKKKE